VTFKTCPKRDSIIEADGHVVVTGGPGCGKTTVALQKALFRVKTGLEPGQKILFLSFSRAAVARVLQAARADLTPATRQHIEVQTFHALCWKIVRGHGHLLGAPSPIRLLAPHDERVLRDGAADDDPVWEIERERLFSEEGRVAFDLFAPKTLELLKRSVALRRLVASRYPLVIVDEAQDTGTSQWECIAQLAEHSQLVCLADLDQQIYDFRADVSPDRIDHIRAALLPMEVDLEGENNRSAGTEIIQFGNDLLTDRPRGATYRGVSQAGFRPDIVNRDRAIRSAIGIVRKKVFEASGAQPSAIAFLTNWGKGVAVIANALQGKDGQTPIPHRVVMDEEEVLLATRVIALSLEPVVDPWSHTATALELISNLYRAKGNLTKAAQLVKNATDARERRFRGNGKCAPSLFKIFEELSRSPFQGSPKQDWVLVRRLYDTSGCGDLRMVANLVIYLMGFNRGRKISDALTDVWNRRGGYIGARDIVEAAITEDQILGSDGDLSGINVMTMHKSKGKEFDGVIVLHLGNISPFSPDKEGPPHLKSRRLLRVGVTRSRYHSHLLTDFFTKSPLLKGHKLS
jgi:DNA helicase-2/ATP-dependent DNA helicase PcrA